MRSNLHVGHISLDPLFEQKLIVDSLPDTTLLHNGSIVGNYSVKATGVDGNGMGTIENKGDYGLEFPMRILQSRHTRVLHGTSIRDTETAFTRCFLRSLPDRKVRKVQREKLKQTCAPQYCKPSVANTEMFYVDIKSAYLSIYERMSWRIEYLRGKYFSNDDDKLVYPFPKDWKSGRSYVVTGALPHSVHIVYDHKILVRPAFNQFENAPLVCAVWDVLSAIARFAIDVYKARYFNLDGAVVSSSMLYPYCDFLDALGLDYRIKHSGGGRILNLASWQIGTHETKRYQTQNLPVLTDSVTVTMQEAEWILTRFMRL